MDFQTLTLSLLFLFALLRFIYPYKKASTRSGKLPPGPTPLPVVGNLLQLGSKIHESLAALAAVHGPLMTVKLGGATAVVASSPAMAREVFQRHDLQLSTRSAPDSLRALETDQLSIIWIPVGHLWRDLRRVCNNKVFSSRSLDATSHVRRQKVGELVEFARNAGRAGVAVDIGQAALITTLNSMSSSFFSADLARLGSERAQEFMDLVHAITEEMGKPNVSDFFPFLRRFDLQGRRRRLGALYTKLHDIFNGFISKRLMSKGTHGDILDALLEEENSVDKSMNRAHILTLLTDLFVGAIDTTSITLEWAMAELLRNPSILSKAREEIEQTIGKDKPIEDSDIARLPYLQAIIKETLRLYPSAPLLNPHKAEEVVEICGYTIPKGTKIVVNAWAISRSSNNWANPNEFLPERFLGLDIDVKGRNFELIPFGAGRRMCAGLPLAMRMLHLILASLLQSFDWKLEQGVAEDMDMEDHLNIVLRKVVPVRVIPIPL